MNSKRFFAMVLLTLIVGILSLQGISHAKDWKYSTFLPPPHWANYCNSWLLDEIEKRTNGQIKIKMYVAQALGKAAEHYNMVATGRVDIAEFTTGFAPGVFPLSEVLQLPFMWNGSLKGSIVANDMFRKGYLDKTLTRDVKLISLNLTEPLKIWTTKPARSMADLKGLQLRVAGGLDAKTMEALGATPIMMPLPEVYQALEKGVVDGAISGFSTGMAFKFHEAAKYVIDTPASIAVHMHMMNKKLWDSLPKNTQQILNQIFRENEIHWSETIDILESKSRVAAANKFGVKIFNPPPAELEKMKAATAGVKDAWIAAMEKKGLPGREAYEALITSMRNHGIILDMTWVKNRAMKK
jgi:TRAP-type C4-dicarboxylate transport system substrate-binding protein